MRGALYESIVVACDNPLCQKALSPGKRMICGRCKLSAYCSVECQRANWHDHKLRCKELSQWGDADMTNTLKLREVMFVFLRKYKAFIVQAFVAHVESSGELGGIYLDIAETLQNRDMASTSNTSLLRFLSFSLMKRIGFLSDANIARERMFLEQGDTILFGVCNGQEEIQSCLIKTALPH